MKSLKSYRILLATILVITQSVWAIEASREVNNQDYIRCEEQRAACGFDNAGCFEAYRICIQTALTSTSLGSNTFSFPQFGDQTTEIPLSARFGPAMDVALGRGSAVEVTLFANPRDSYGIDGALALDARLTAAGLNVIGDRVWFESNPLQGTRTILITDGLQAMKLHEIIRDFEHILPQVSIKETQGAITGDLLHPTLPPTFAQYSPGYDPGIKVQQDNAFYLAHLWGQFSQAQQYENGINRGIAGLELQNASVDEGEEMATPSYISLFVRSLAAEIQHRMDSFLELTSFFQLD